MYRKIDRCRICGNTRLERVLDLGEQMLTGVFPKTRDEKVTVGPLCLTKCVGDDVCGLLQLEVSYDLGEMYGDNYGYRSGLNADMVKHLNAKVARIKALGILKAGDLVVDIGSNDSTTLQAYPKDLQLVGIDPTGAKFHSYYPEHIALIPDFFSAHLLEEKFPGRKAKVIPSFSMFYDLEAPMEFARQVAGALADDGIWVFEQSYMPTMLDMNSYDTACHEHLEYYALKQIKWMTERIGLHIHDVEFNDVNGGSFSITAGKKPASAEGAALVTSILQNESDIGLDKLEPFHAFAKRVEETRAELLAFVHKEMAQGKTFAALGASTKGNVLLQYCKLDTDLLTYVGEVNPEKYGRYTPGTFVPIISEDELLQKAPDYLLVLPWHFRKFFDNSAKLKPFKKLYPLPNLQIV